MTSLWRALSAETLKLRRTLALWMAFVAPSVVVGLLFLQVYMTGGPKKPLPETEAWMSLAQGTTSLWSVLMLPLFITLESALLGGLEHNEKQWKHLFALPVPRWTIYTAKLFACLVLISLSTIVLWAGVIAVGLGLRVVLPSFGITGAVPVPWAGISRMVLPTLLAAGMIIALHTWVSLRWRSFTLSVGVGMAATVIGFIVMQSEKWGKFYPWSFPLNTFAGEGQNMSLALTLGITGGIAVGIIGCWDVIRRDVL